MIGSYGREVSSAARRAPDQGQPIRLLSVGRLSAEKGLDLLLRAVAELSRDHPQIELVIAGTGPEEAALRRLGAELGLTDKVRYAGYVSDMPSLYAGADLVVQSSLTEGLPNVILEAAYLGVPVVATDVGGTREVIEHGVSGWLVPAGSVSALTTGIGRYLDDPAGFVAMASRGRRHIEEHFSIDARARKQMLQYVQLAVRTT
jgi:glycosyltransferase involved in cell wall biosynthesis